MRGSLRERAILLRIAPTLVKPLVCLIPVYEALPHGDGRAFTRPRYCVFQLDPRHPNLLSLYGGKLTGYRAMASFQCR